MIDLDAWPELNQPVLVAAFEGWNDAADAASSVVDHLGGVWDAEQLATLESDDFYDFQVNRPIVSFDAEGERQFAWPETRFLVARPPKAPCDIVLVRGVEPNMHWNRYCAEIADVARAVGARLTLVLGALLADTPHTRPIPVTGSASDSRLAESLSLELSRYEGPTGVVGVLQDTLRRGDFSTVSFWAAVPHYVAQPPCPKATVALLRKVEDVLEAPIPVGDLAEEAKAWERGVDDLAHDDSEVAAYVRSLEEARDAAELPEASGEAIAREFERYLRRRDDT